MKVLVTGAKGQLGCDLTEVLADRELYLFDLDLDVTDNAAVAAVCRDIKPDVTIHCAAMTDVDGCETRVDDAYKVNSLGAANVAMASRAVGAPMVYVSTDFVFDGTKKVPYTEFDDTNPLSVYGRSKLAGEIYVARFQPESYIVRTAWLYGKTGHNFVKTILRLAGEKDELSIVTDQTGSPTFSRDLAGVIRRLIDSGFYGTYHATNSGSATWNEFAKEITRLAGLSVDIKPMTSAELNRPAKRPAYSVLDNCALRLRGIEAARPWQEALADYFKQ